MGFAGEMTGAMEPPLVHPPRLPRRRIAKRRGSVLRMIMVLTLYLRLTEARRYLFRV